MNIINFTLIKKLKSDTLNYWKRTMNPMTEFQYHANLQKPYYWDSILTDISAACRTELNAEPDRTNWEAILATYGFQHTFLKKMEYIDYLWRQSNEFHSQMKEAEELYVV